LASDSVFAARKKAWFNETIFVFVADYTAGSAGKEDLSIRNYQIPLFIYAPKLSAASEDSQLASQIDLAPTLLGLLNLNYESTFFCHNLLQPSSLPPRVLVGNYKHLGLSMVRIWRFSAPKRCCGVMMTHWVPAMK
jgi:hypothetical protein